jgi:hypothetical protein
MLGSSLNKATHPVNLTIFSVLSVMLLFLALVGCAGPPALQRAVIGYDETTAKLDQQLLLLNIARLNAGLPIHFTTTSSIAATFDWTTTIGAGAQLEETKGTNFFNFNLGARASENPTFSIIPVTGQEFTERILTPFDDSIFNFAVFQGWRVDRVMRLIGREIEFQNPDGSFVRVIENDPAKPEQYKEFRRIATHLAWLNRKRSLFVRKLVFEETLIHDFKGTLRSEDIQGGFEKGLNWRQNPDGNYRLTRLTVGRIAVTNFDPMALTHQQRYQLNRKIKRLPKSFVYLDLRPGHPGGDFPIRGAIKLRSLNQIILFIANGVDVAPEFHVEKDPRTGQIPTSPPATLQVSVTDTEPPTNVPSVKYGKKYYSVADTRWDRESFMTLSYLFQTAVGEIAPVGLPITISK